MRAVVLVKQVPDLRAGSVGVRPDGTIDRAAAAPITNPADLHAIEAAVQVVGDDGDVCAVSMGPPRAEETLREAIVAGATRAVLLCDHALAGSDTWATANALAAAIRWIGDVDLVCCGISAMDGETGQVGPSVAQRLGWPQATACEALEVSDGIVIARRVVEGGYERLRLPLPAVVTIGETGFAPRYPTMRDRRRGATTAVEHVDIATVGLGADVVGLACSPTKVARMAPSPLPDRGCRFVDASFDHDDLVAALVERRSFVPRDLDVQPVPATAPPVDGAGGVEGDAQLWVVCGLGGDGLDAPSRELLSKAVTLAPELGGGVGAVIVGADVERAVPSAACHGAEVVYLAQGAELAEYRCEPYARVLADAIAARRPNSVLFAATTTGRDLAPRIASMLDTGLAADCTDLYVDSWTRLGTTYTGLLHMVRPAMAGGVLATCLCPEARPQMATVRPGVFALQRFERQPRVERLAVSLQPSDLRVSVLERHISAADVDLRDADVIIAGGAGCDRSRWHLIEELADAIGGRVAASRGAVEAGLAQRAQQVGQTGATVHPKLYVACGISGALQHAVGMQDSATILAINRDPHAVIFRLAHFGIVADVADAVPALIAALRRQR